jgi:hypothetical protein
MVLLDAIASNNATRVAFLTSWSSASVCRHSRNLQQ